MATKYNALASLSNIPISYMTEIDGHVSERWNPDVMLFVDGASEVVGVVGVPDDCLVAAARPSGGVHCSGGDIMTRFVIAPHMRLHEWVADEKGYFTEAGLDYEFKAALKSDDTKGHDLGDRVGAYQTFERGRTCDVSSACHWTVNMAAAAGHGRIYVDAYSVSPCAIFVPPDSPITRPEDLAGVPIAVGYQSGSHYSTIEALDMFLPPEQIKLSFADGLLFRRMEKLYDREIRRPACSAAPTTSWSSSASARSSIPAS